MRALVFDGPGRLTLREIPRPEPGEGEIVVRVHTATICGTDVRILAGRKTREIRRGHPIGHEVAGTVAGVGTGVSGWSEGDHVGVCVVETCGLCPACQADEENLCEQRRTLGYQTDGAFAEYMAIPARAVERGNLFRLPERLSMETAPLLEPMACCINGQRQMRLDEMAGRDGGRLRIVIFGAGPIGLLHLLLLRAREAGSEVTMVEPLSHRREPALALGADAVCAPGAFKADGSFDAAILAAGVPELVPVALRAVRKGGRVNLFAGFDAGARVELDPNVIHYHQIQVTGASESRRRDYAEALKWVADGLVDPSCLITHRLPLERHAEAFDLAMSARALKVAFEIQPRP